MLQIITSHLSDHLFTDFNLSKELKRLAQDSYRTLERSREIPIAFADLLKMAIKGETKLNLEIVGSQEPLHKIDSMVNRLITCIIIAAVLMTLKVIISTLRIWFALPIAPTASCEYCPTINWSILPTSIWRINSIKTGQVNFRR